jgi:putative membrane protein
MNEFVEMLVVGLPSMFGHAAVTVGMLAGGIWLYFRLTPYDDMKLVKEGNVAAGLSFLSIVVGLAVPLSFCLAQVSTIHELLFWSAFTVAVQLFAFKVCDWFLSDLPARIERGEVSAAVVLLGVKLAAAFINSAMH